MHETETHEPDEISRQDHDRSSPAPAEPEVVAGEPDDDLVTRVVILDGQSTLDPLPDPFEDDEDDDFDEGDDFDEDDDFDEETI